MAIDTAEKRYSAIHVTMPWRSASPIPSGAIDQADRQTIAFLYSGILAGGAVPSTPLLNEGDVYFVTTFTGDLPFVTTTTGNVRF